MQLSLWSDFLYKIVQRYHLCSLSDLRKYISFLEKKNQPLFTGGEFIMTPGKVKERLIIYLGFKNAFKLGYIYMYCYQFPVAD